MSDRGRGGPDDDRGGMNHGGGDDRGSVNHGSGDDRGSVNHWCSLNHGDGSYVVNHRGSVVDELAALGDGGLGGHDWYDRGCVDCGYHGLMGHQETRGGGGAGQKSGEYYL